MSIRFHLPDFEFRLFFIGADQGHERFRAIASIAASVFGGSGASERDVTGEKVDSSQPAKTPLAEAIRETAKSRFAKGLHSIDNLLAASNRLAGMAD